MKYKRKEELSLSHVVIDYDKEMREVDKADLFSFYFEIDRSRKCWETLWQIRTSGSGFLLDVKYKHTTS